MLAAERSRPPTPPIPYPCRPQKATSWTGSALGPELAKAPLAGALPPIVAVKQPKKKVPRLRACTRIGVLTPPPLIALAALAAPAAVVAGAVAAGVVAVAAVAASFAPAAAVAASASACAAVAASASAAAVAVAVAVAVAAVAAGVVDGASPRRLLPPALLHRRQRR